MDDEIVARSSRSNILNIRRSRGIILETNYLLIRVFIKNRIVVHQFSPSSDFPLPFRDFLGTHDRT